jgi:beta-alanine--pyruvate transaminase
MMDKAEAPIELFHGYTYSGHPLATAAALAALDAYSEEDMFNQAAGMAEHFADCAHALKDLDHVIDIRTIGLVAGIELAPRPGNPGSRGYEIMKAGWDNNLMIRVTGDILAFSPPLTISRTEIETLFDITAKAIASVD